MKKRQTDPLILRNAAMAIQCGITTGHLAPVFDLTERQIRGLRKKWDDGQDLAAIPKQGRPRSEAWVCAPCNNRDKARRDPVQTVTLLSREGGISWSTSSHVVGNLNLMSRAHQGRQKHTAKDKRQHLQRGRQPLRRLHWGRFVASAVVMVAFNVATMLPHDPFQARTKELASPPHALGCGLTCNCSFIRRSRAVRVFTPLLPHMAWQNRSYKSKGLRSGECAG